MLYIISMKHVLYTFKAANWQIYMC